MKLNTPRTENELKVLQDELYQKAKDHEFIHNTGFKQLYKIVESRPNIISAIHKIKGNKGSKTSGIDKLTIDYILQSDIDVIINDIQQSLKKYNASNVRSVQIPKKNGDFRTLGIPTIKDRIIQECVRNVIEPIAEAQFFAHSYGFRPMRDTHMAVERLKDIVYKTSYGWAIEGDISKFFDNVNHNILLRKMYGLGIRDNKVLMIVKQMLKAGVMNNIIRNEIGTPQGGIISPLLANIYLHSFDKFVTREWETIKTKYQFTSNRNKYQSLHNKTNQIPRYLIRYADDWIILTSSKENAEKLKYKIDKFLKENLKLKLSEDKTKITNLHKKRIDFLGFRFRTIPIERGKSTRPFTSSLTIDEDKFAEKIKSIRREIKLLNRQPNQKAIISQINNINSKIRGILEYYSSSQKIYMIASKYSSGITMKALKIFKKHFSEATLMEANKVCNLISLHSKYSTQIASVKYENVWFGLTDITFICWKMRPLKNQKETPYSNEGRNIHNTKKGKTSPLTRLDELTHKGEQIHLTIWGHTKSIYNLEYFMNRAYTYNRDNFKCRVCSKEVGPQELNTHHNRINLSISEINKVSNLSSVHHGCHVMIHDNANYENLVSKAIWNKIKKFRMLLEEK